MRTCVDTMELLIDYENVGNFGIDGAELLLPDDSVTIFYSASCRTMEGGRYHAIESSRCGLELCRLNAGGHNALDFYIVSRAAELFARGAAEVAIVSHDMGFHAARSYWSELALVPSSLIVAPTIGECVRQSADVAHGRGAELSLSKTLDVEKAVARINEKRAAEARKAALRTACAAAKIGIRAAIALAREYEHEPRELYRECMRRCGIAAGRELYKVLREHL